MPKVGCFWPGLFKSSNCLFPWAARETGKRSSLCAAIHISVPEPELGMMASPSPGHPVGGCAAWLCSTKTRCCSGASPQGALPQIFLINLFCNFFPPCLGTLSTPSHPGTDTFQAALTPPSLPAQDAPLERLPSLTPFPDAGEASPAS